MQDGNRVFTEGEWSLFSIGLDDLRYQIEQNIEAETDDVEVGIPVFDSLTAEQKLTVLAEVAHYLRNPEVPAPPHTACTEGTIMAVFIEMRTNLEMELDPSQDLPSAMSVHVRQGLLDACGKEEQREEPLPDVNSTNLKEWAWLLEEIQDRVFWDYDFSMGDEFLDLPPDQAGEKLRQAGIDPDYYLTVPAEPDERGLIAARQTLARLLSLPIPNDHGLYDTIDDLYHSVMVGPCTAEIITQWEDHPWIEIIHLTEPGWDCTYSTWREALSSLIPSNAFKLDEDVSETAEELPENVEVVARGKLWGIQDNDGSWWCGLIENCWTDDPDEEDLPALTYETKYTARAAFVQAERMYKERARRHIAAIEQIDQRES